jgi:hypothetical protein
LKTVKFQAVFETEDMLQLEGPKSNPQYCGGLKILFALNTKHFFPQSTMILSLVNKICVIDDLGKVVKI